MPEAGNSTGGKLSSLTDRLKAKTEEERQITEKMIEDCFENLSVNLTASAKNALDTIETAIRHEVWDVKRNVMTHIKLLNSGLMEHWLAAALLGLALMLGLFIGGLGMTKLAQHYLSSLRVELSDLKHQMATEKTTLRQIHSQTWGLELVEVKEGRFIILPPNMTPKPGWTYAQRPAIKLE
jgi:hypothetical protein